MERPRGTCYSDDPKQWCRWSPMCRSCVPTPRDLKDGLHTLDLAAQTRALGVDVDTDPLQRAVDDLVRRFDPGGYELQCPVRGCGWHLFVPRMELDPEPLEEETGHWVVDAHGVPREDLELVLRGHIDWHAELTETGATDVPPAPVPAVMREDLDLLHDEQDEMAALARPDGWDGP